MNFFTRNNLQNNVRFKRYGKIDGESSESGQFVVRRNAATYLV